MTSPPNRSYRWLFLYLALIGLVADQGTKYGIFAALYNDGHGDHFALIPGAFRLTAEYTGVTDPGDDWRSPLRTVSGAKLPHVNQGALFGIGHGNNTLFTVISLAAALAILCWGLTSAARDRWLSVSLGLILAGTLGNLYDRVVFDGVRDFLHWYYVVNWPVFNVADCCLVCGASLLLLQAFVLQPVPTDAPAENASSTAEVAEVN